MPYALQQNFPQPFRKKVPLLNTFKYKAVSRDGAQIAGVIEAYDEYEAVARIKQEGSVVVKISQIPERRERIDLNEPLWVSEKVLSMTSSQFAILLRAGLPMVRTIEIVAEQTTDRLMCKILSQVAGDVAAGYGLAQSFETRGKKMPVSFIETVRAGEESGTLENSFAKLEKYYAKSYKTKNKVKSALTYPAFLCVLAVVVIAIIMVFTVPMLVGTFASTGNELPGITKVLIAISNFVATKWWLLILSICALIVGIRLYGKTEKGRLQFSNLAMRAPVVGRVNRMKGASQFANTFSTLLASGLATTHAIVITSRVLDNFALGQTIKACTLGLEEGKRLGDVLRNNPYLPPLLIEMTGVGEESGALEETLDTVGAYYDVEVENATNKLLSMLEPTITIVMGLVVGFIMIALYYPMFTMYNGM